MPSGSCIGVRKCFKGNAWQIKALRMKIEKEKYQSPEITEIDTRLLFKGENIGGIASPGVPGGAPANPDNPYED